MGEKRGDKIAGYGKKRNEREEECSASQPTEKIDKPKRKRRGRIKSHEK